MNIETQNKLDAEAFDNVVSTQILAAEKASGTERRMAMRIREVVVRVGVAPKIESNRLQKKFKRLSIGPLVSWIGRFARRAATAKYLLEKLSPDSVFAPNIRNEQAKNLTAFILATKEYQTRGIKQNQPADPKSLGENELKNSKLPGSVL